jgi:hypothetical protein
MPMVGKKKFPYTKAGKEDAAMYAKKKKAPVKKKK